MDVPHPVMPPPETPLPHQLRPAGPSVGTPRWLPAVLWIVAFALLPLCVIVGRFATENGGWLLFTYIMFGWMVQGGLGVLAAASLFLLPRVNPPVERRAGVRTGVVVHLLLGASWLTGLLGMLAFGDYGDAPGSETAPAPLVDLYGMDRAVEIGDAVGPPLVGISLLTGLAAVVLVVVRRLAAAVRS